MDDRHARPRKVRVMDKRRVSTGEGAPGEAGSSNGPEPAPAPTPGERQEEDMAERIEAREQDLLDDLRRLQAEFDNYRKRMLREQTAMASRASARLIERLLPVLDNFERATAHGEGGPGIALVHKELRQVLEQEGLSEIDAEGAPFDPHLHEAFQAVDDAVVDAPVVQSVFRRGYRLGDQVLRPAMVIVARPPEPESEGDEPEGQKREG
jgi:molecular chaperone GrpE